jgi:hypothetical protein
MGNQNSGRRPAPTALKVLRGNPGKRKLNDQEPIAPAGPVVKPEYLTALASQVWDEIAPGCLAMGTLTGPDVPTFARLCELEVTARQSSQGKDEPGWKGQREERDAATAIRTYYDYFGMTPSGRSRIKVPKKAEPESKWQAVRA